MGYSPACLRVFFLSGSEIEVLTDLLLSGSLTKINKTLIEFHDWMAATPERKSHSAALRSSLKAMQKISGRFELLAIDDESYGTSNFEMPKC